MKILVREAVDRSHPDQDLNNVVHCVQLLLDTITYLTAEEFKSFSMLDWNIVIRTVASIFELLVAKIIRQNIDYTESTRLSNIKPHLLRLRSRMGDLSISTEITHDLPDMFFLFYSALDPIVDTYDAMVNHLDQNTQSDNILKNSFRYTPALCPVINGALKSTDYWSILEQNQFESD